MASGGRVAAVAPARRAQQFSFSQFMRGGEVRLPSPAAVGAQDALVPALSLAADHPLKERHVCAARRDRSRATLASPVRAGGHFRCRLPVTGSVRLQARGRLCFGLIAASRQAGIPAGRVVAWGLAAMRPERWRGIVGVTAGSPSSLRRKGHGRVQEQRRK
jgi:hypothetical protein